MLCSEAVLVNSQDGLGHATLLRCRRWSCDLCRPWQHSRIKRACREGKPNSFLTLTVNPRLYETYDEAARALKDAWVNLRKSIVKKWSPSGLPFIAVFEATKRGWPHLHIAMRAPFIPQRWISGRMAALIKAPVVDIRFIRSQRAVASYVAKYISKAPDQFRGCKRWWRSHDYQLEPEERPIFTRFGPHCDKVDMNLDQYVRYLTARGAVFVEESPHYVAWECAIQGWRPSPGAMASGP